jgi:hypothetical protein
MSKSRLSGLQGTSRRQFLRWSAAAGAALALDRWRVLEVVSDSAGVAMADEAACSATNRSVHLVAGDGGFAWFQLLWPHVAVAASTDDAFAFHAKGLATKAKDTDRAFWHAPESPWQALGPEKRVSAFMAGINQAHTPTPASSATLGNGQSLLAGVASIQREMPSLVPVIALQPVSFGTAAGAPPVATVADAAGLVQLFSNVAPTTTLAAPEDAALFEAYYGALLGMDAAAGRPTWARSLRTGKISARLLSKNLEHLLAPTDDDLERYGIDATTPDKLAAIGRALITTAKAFGLGLTQSVIVPVLRDDPHEAFGDLAQLGATVSTLGRILDELMNDLGAIADPLCASRSLADATVLTVHGDTPKDPLVKAGWPDGTPGNSNWLYVMGNGYLRTGWFGGVEVDGTVTGFDPESGKEVPGQSSEVTAAAAGAAVAYAVAKGNRQRVRDFFGGSIDGMVV